MILWLSVLIRIVANPFSNVFQKLLTQRRAHPLFLICAVHGMLSLACLPFLVRCIAKLSGEFYFVMAVCAILTVSGNVLIVYALKHADLSLLGPINSYKAIVSLLPGIVFLGELPGLPGLAGMVLILAGSSFLIDRASSPQNNAYFRFFRDRGVQLRFAALVVSAIEAVVMKRAMLISTALATFVFWSMFGFLCSLAAVFLTLGKSELACQFKILQTNAKTYLMLFLTTGLMQGCTIIVFGALFVGYALALFQTSTLISVALGWTIFREKDVLKRLIGAVIMAVGAALIVLTS